jgi:hypothetical protein
MWPIALSFRGPDLEIATQTAEALQRRGIAAYCYAEHVPNEAGHPLYLLHQTIFGSAHLIAIFLRADFLERPFTKFEYDIALGRKNWQKKTAFLTMSNASKFLVPSGSANVLAVYEVESPLVVDTCAKFLQTSLLKAIGSGD